MTDEENKAGDEPKTESAVSEPINTDKVSPEGIIAVESNETPIEDTVDETQIETIPYQNIRPGMVVRVHEKIKDTTTKGERERVQVFQGIVMGIKSPGVSRTMTVRKDSKGWMVEKIFPLSSPNIEKIEVVKQYRVRRAKLSYLRDIFKRKMKEIK